LPINWLFDPAVVPFGARRQYFDDQKRLRERLLSNLVTLAGRDDVGLKIGIRMIRRCYSCCELRVAGPAGGQQHLDLEPRRTAEILSTSSLRGSGTGEPLISS
jgi:hypothetical protein